MNAALTSLYSLNDLLNEADARRDDPLIRALAAALEEPMQLPEVADALDKIEADACEIDTENRELKRRLQRAEEGIAELRGALDGTVSFAEGFEDDEAQEDMEFLAEAQRVLAKPFTDDEIAEQNRKREEQRQRDHARFVVGRLFAELEGKPTAVEYRRKRGRTWLLSPWRSSALTAAQVQEASVMAAHQADWAEWRLAPAPEAREGGARAA